MAGDASYAKTGLLLHGNGANNATVFTDSSASPKIVTAGGSAKTSTARSVFGGSSMLFSGANDFLTTPNHAGWDFGAGDFTVEFFLYIAAHPSGYAGLALHDSIGGTRGWLAAVSSASESPARGLSFSCFSGATQYAVNDTVPFSTGGWMHVAITRDGGTLRLFKGGALVSSNTGLGTASINSPTVPLVVGSLYATSAINPGTSLNGNIAELRIVKGEAVYKAAFTPPAAPFLEYAAQVAGVVRDDSGNPCARTVRAYRRDTGALVGNTVSNSGTGAYSMNLKTFDEVQRIVLDDAGGTLYNDIIDRVIPA